MTTKRTEPAATAESAGWMTTAEVTRYIAAHFGYRIQPRTVQAWCARAHHPLRATRVGGAWLVHRDDLARWLADDHRRVSA